jgi:hypothetical protein
MVDQCNEGYVGRRHNSGICLEGLSTSMTNLSQHSVRAEIRRGHFPRWETLQLEPSSLVAGFESSCSDDMTGYNSVQFGISTTFRRNVYPPSSRSKGTPSKKPATSWPQPWFLTWLTLRPPEDGGNSFLPNVGHLVTNYNGLQRGRSCSSVTALRTSHPA